MQGISAIIVVVLILLITISLASAGYLFFSSIFSQTTSTASQTTQEIVSGLSQNFIIESVIGEKVIIRNIGQSPITNFAIYVDEKPVNFINSSAVVQPGELYTFIIYDFIDYRNSKSIKVSTKTISQSFPISIKNIYPDLADYIDSPMNGATCDSCESCTQALNNSQYSIVILIQDILDYSGSCINNPTNFSNKIFACLGHRIDGTRTSYSYGIYLNGKQNNTIKNCIFSDFHSGIRLEYGSFNNTLINNIADSNTYYGIAMIANSNNNTLINNEAKNNSFAGFYMGGVGGSHFNTLINNKAIQNFNGIQVYGSNNNKFIEGYYCNNNNVDINIQSGVNNIGYNNTCNKTINYNDTGTTNCTFTC
ncbi:MAG: NosD domain-containing protein [Candidatus Aenigmatarchaeota archaeon]